MAVRDRIEKARASLMFLPPHSADVHPPGKAFVCLEAMLRKAAERTASALWTPIGSLVDLCQTTGRANYFSAGGYEAGRRISA